MITLQVTLKPETLSNLIGAASSAGMDFNDYIESRLSADLGLDVEWAKPVLGLAAGEVAGLLFNEAQLQQAHEINDDYTVDGTFYLVEDLYRKLELEPAWNLRDRGNRIMIGKAFKRLVDAQQGSGTMLDDDHGGICVRVVFEGRTGQNQAQYRTHRFG